jgi:DNA-directed RNA polymerase specialized sigma24 family protein
MMDRSGGGEHLSRRMPRILRVRTRQFFQWQCSCWVLTIMRNTAYTWLRKNRPSAVLVVEDLEAVETA